MGGPEKLAEPCLLWIPKFVLSGSCLDDPLCLLAFSVFRQAHQRGQELNGWHGELLKRGLLGPAGEEGAAWMWVGEPCTAGAVLHMQWEGDTGVLGAAGPSVVSRM